MNQYVLMARFNAWVNGRVYDTVAQLTDAAYREDRGAFFGSIHHTLNHLLVVDRLWRGRIESADHGILALDQILHDDFEALRAAREAEDRRFVALVEGLDDARLAAPVAYRSMIGDGETETVRAEHILLTLFNHQTHHRGQVHCMLTQAGLVTPALDLVFFLDELGLSQGER